MKVKSLRDGGVEVALDSDDATLLAHWADELEQLLQPADLPSEDPLAQLVGIDTRSVRPDDPVLHRLFPDAYREDEVAAQEFRRYTEHDLRRRKAADAQALAASLPQSSASGPVTLRLDADLARQWLGALNDLRLVLGTRLGVHDDDADADDDADVEPDAPTSQPMLLAYRWLTYVQATLVDALHPRHP